ncbi:Degradation activator [Sedimentisphaera cyanobacteriorum]|uniref:Degradation activator n=1 Tax=Sedimentisphaera cyanobacteriorum TaxID=1940790 RepID=A0A1Q2HSP6_9BACT|nr:LacI family DNA-binding transcriptional regulator [Sedimentisphaera cyanobacteriorum]AQQ10253.1 Degradation activator [Sedimentisphaera cyanobacteriorum]
MTKEKPTIRDIASNLNVSAATVSRALRDAGKVSEKLRHRIIDEAEKIGYKPNFAAKALRNQSSQLIGLIISNFFSFQIDELVSHIQSYAEQQQYGIILGVTQWDTEHEIQQMDFMVNKRVDGIIIKSKGLHESIDKIQKVALEGTPVVSLLDKMNIPNVNSVLVDNVTGGYLATKYLLQKGHRNILYVTYKQAQSTVGNDSHFSRERYFGLLRAHAEMNTLRPDGLVFYDPSSCEDNDTEGCFREYFRKNKNYTAIFAYDDQIAAGIARAIKAEGYKIPEDFSIIGFDDSALVNKWSTPAITVVKQPDKQVAYEAVNLITNRKNFSSITDHNPYLCPELIERDSVRDISKKCENYL